MFVRHQVTLLQRIRCVSSRASIEVRCSLHPTYQSFSTTTAANLRKPLPVKLAPIRRKRPKVFPTIMKGYAEQSDEFIRQALSGGQTEPIPQSEASLEDYQKKASLSPWVPAPDSVGRRMLDMSNASASDIHIDLGCGDGRINFQAIDRPYGVFQSIGIDVDEVLIDKARERLGKRHPAPNVQFHLADLLDSGHDVWRKTIPEATIITMFFVQKALGQIRPLLEHALQGKSCNIVTCGYAMPGWNPSNVDRILDLTIHLYEWKGSSEDLQLTGIDLVGDDLLYDNELNQTLKGQNTQTSRQQRPSIAMDNIVMPMTPLIPHSDLNHSKDEDSDDEDNNSSRDYEYLQGGELDGVALGDSFESVNSNEVK